MGMSAIYFKGKMSKLRRLEGRGVGSSGAGVSPSPTTPQQIPAIEIVNCAREGKRNPY